MSYSPYEAKVLACAEADDRGYYLKVGLMSKNGRKLVQTTGAQYRRQAEDFYPLSCVFRIDITDFWVSDGTLESSLNNQHL